MDKLVKFGSDEFWINAKQVRHIGITSFVFDDGWTLCWKHKPAEIHYRVKLN